MIYYTHRHPVKTVNDLDIKRIIQIKDNYQHIMGAVHKLVDGESPVLVTEEVSQNNPDVLWARSSKQHYDWLFDCWSQALVLCHRHVSPLKRVEDVILGLSRSPHNLLNHGWMPPYSPSLKPYKGSPENVWKQFLVDSWNMESAQWPNGNPSWIIYNKEKGKFVINQEE